MKPDKSATAAELRRQAEARFQAKLAEVGPAPTDTDWRRLQHELEVHQIELEMQNEELRNSQAETALALGKYTDLYDFAPTGYFTFAGDGTILAVNLTGARLLGFERARLIDRRFGLLLAEADRMTFHGLLQNAFLSRQRESCEMALPRERSFPLFVRIEAQVVADGGQCRAAVLDITERHQEALARDRLILELQRSQVQVKMLSGLMPICSYCKKIRDDQGYWEQVESYIAHHSEAHFTHGICPDCFPQYFPGISDTR